MKRGSTIFLKVIIIFIALGSLALLIWEPQTEGRNVNADLFTIYFRDPFLAYMYIGQNTAFSPASVKALRTIKYCALAIIGFILGAEVFVIFPNRGKDDIAGGVAMGVLITFISIIIATVATIFQRLAQNAVDLKSENDLTV